MATFRKKATCAFGCVHRPHSSLISLTAGVSFQFFTNNWDIYTQGFTRVAALYRRQEISHNLPFGSGEKTPQFTLGASHVNTFTATVYPLIDAGAARPNEKRRIHHST